MNLHRLELFGFRSYQEPVEVVFEPGMNVFVGPNEAGKTSILLGVVAALFVPRSSAERDALRSGAVDCRVALEYELPDGSRWRVERDLAAHRGCLSRWRDDAWSPVAASITEVAALVRQHTGCDESLFRASLLVGHEGVEVGWSGDVARAIEERLEALIAGSAAGVTAARAVEKLEKARKTLSGPYKGGIVRAAAAASDARAEVERLRMAAGRLAGSKSRAAELAAEAGRLKNERDETEVVVKSARQVAELEERTRHLEARRAALDRAIDAHERLAAIAGKRHWSQPLAAAGGVLVIGALATVALGGGWRLAAGLACVGVAALAIAFAGWRTRPAAVDDGPRQRDLAERAALGRDFEELRSRMEEAAASRLPAPELAARAARLAQLPGLIQESGGAALRAELEAAALEREAEWLAEAEDAAGVAEREAARLKRRAAALELARHELAGAIDDVRAAVAPRVAELAGERLIQVASHWAVELDPRAALGFRAVRRDGGPPRALSDGTADQFHFAVRLALADALLGELRPPLLLDDPFRYADAERRSALHALLVEIATTRQVLYFTVEAPGDLPLTHRLPGLQVSV